MVEHALRSTLLFLSRKEELRDVATRLPSLKRLSQRFVAGVTLEEALSAVRALAEQGCTASFDHLGEDVRDLAGTRAELEEYRGLLAQLTLTGLPANVSVKLSQLGLSFDEGLARQNARALVQDASRQGVFVRLDMEGSALTEKTLALYEWLRAEGFGVDDVGVVLQSSLRRTDADLTRMLALGARIRLCKGAYQEPPELAFPRKQDVDAQYLLQMRRLLDSGGYHGIATHDPRMIDETLAHAQRAGLSRSSFELQMLHGVRRDLREQLVRDGWRVRVYVPYGESWYPYLMRRLAERPANLWFLAKNLARG